MNKQQNNETKFSFTGPTGSLAIVKDDVALVKLSMLIDVICKGQSPSKTAKKYGYTRQRFYQILEDYKESGLEGLIPKRKGPKKNHIRTEAVVNLIIRYKFLDPDITSDVIAQKLKQEGYNVSIRSVERTITEYGLSKKTLQ